MQQSHTVRLGAVSAIFADGGMSQANDDRIVRLIRKHGTHAKIKINVHDPLAENDHELLTTTLRDAEADGRLILSSWQ